MENKTLYIILAIVGIVALIYFLSQGNAGLLQQQATPEPTQEEVMEEDAMMEEESMESEDSEDAMMEGDKMEEESGDSMMEGEVEIQGESY